LRGEKPVRQRKALERYVDAIVARVDKHETLIEMAKSARIPVINALSDREHPCQIISDLFTIHEKSGTFEGLKWHMSGMQTTSATPLCWDAHSPEYPCMWQCHANIPQTGG